MPGKIALSVKVKQRRALVGLAVESTYRDFKKGIERQVWHLNLTCRELIEVLITFHSCLAGEG